MLLRYLMVGGFCYLLNLAILTLGVEVFALHYAVANLLSLAIMTLTGHLVHRKSTFRSNAPYAGELGRFAIVTIVQTGGAVAAMGLLIEGLGVHYLAANILVTFAFTAAAFLANRHYAFRESPALPDRQ